MTDTPTPGEAAALPTIEALMVLACEFASAHYLFERFGGQGHGDVRDAARESLRAALAWAYQASRLAALEEIKQALADLDDAYETGGDPSCGMGFSDAIEAVTNLIDSLNLKETP